MIEETSDPASVPLNQIQHISNLEIQVLKFLLSAFSGAIIGLLISLLKAPIELFAIWLVLCLLMVSFKKLRLIRGLTHAACITAVMLACALAPLKYLDQKVGPFPNHAISLSEVNSVLKIRKVPGFGFPDGSKDE